MCLSCWGTAATQCWTCNSPYVRSNNTCAVACLSYFGVTLNAIDCIYCNLNCTICAYAFNNCTACKTSGTWASYLNMSDPTYMTCGPTCDLLHFQNKLNHQCDPCNINCTACYNNANYCTACIAGFSWSFYTCYSPCPTAYFLDNGGLNCTSCSLYCSVCVGPKTNCTVCVSSGTYTAYLYNITTLTIYGSCERLCPTGYPENFGGAGPNLCLPCNSSCARCTNNPSPCTYCNTGYFLYQSTCINPCPNGTF